MSDRVLHCWKDLHAHAEEKHGWGSDAWAEAYVKPGATCMLEAGHSGEHEFTDDGEIGVRFTGPEEWVS